MAPRATGWFMGTDHGAGVWRGPRVEAARRDARRRVQAGRDQDQGARRARRLCRLSAENYGASEWWLLLEPQM